MTQDLDKYIVIQEHVNGIPVYYQPEFFAASTTDLRILLRLHGVNKFEAHRVQNQSELKLNEAKLN